MYNTELTTEKLHLQLEVIFLTKSAALIIFRLYWKKKKNVAKIPVFRCLCIIILSSMLNVIRNAITLWLQLIFVTVS